LRLAIFPEFNEIGLEILCVLPGYEETAYSAAKRFVNVDLDIVSDIDRNKYRIIPKIAELLVNDLTNAESIFTNAIAAFSKHQALYYIASTRMHLAYLYILKKDTEKAKLISKLAIQTMREQGYFNLAYWVPKVAAEVLAFSMEHQIEVEFCEMVALNRTASLQTRPFFRLTTHANQAIQDAAIRIIERAGTKLHQDAIRILNANRKRSPYSVTRLENWLKTGWLTPHGLVALMAVLNGIVRLEILLLMINPRLDGNSKEIARELQLSGKKVSLGTIATHRKQILSLLRDANIISASHENPVSLATSLARNGYIDLRADPGMANPASH